MRQKEIRFNSLCSKNSVKIANPRNFAQTIQIPKSVFKYNILQTSAQFVGQFKRQFLGRQPVARMQIFEGASQCAANFPVLNRAADVHVFA